jgi:uncharacterized glyoxalase superfamily protein PhnB
MQRIIPMLAYEDAGAAIDWLSKAFGFEEDESMRHTDDGTVTHAEMSLQGATIMLATPNKDYRGPRRHAEECEQARKWLDNPWVVDGVWIAVDDLDAHYEQAVKGGARILRQPKDPGIGVRMYTAEDLEGHRWMFGESGE